MGKRGKATVMRESPHRIRDSSEGYFQHIIQVLPNVFFLMVLVELSNYQKEILVYRGLLVSENTRPTSHCMLLVCSQ